MLVMGNMIDRNARIFPGKKAFVYNEQRIRSEQMMKEYWKKPELTANTIKNGWLHTGDLAGLSG